MKVLIVGGRDYADKQTVFETLDRLHEEHQFTHLIHGGATGADSLGDSWGWINKVQVVVCKANWRGLGKVAGPIRNRRMLELDPDLVVAFPGGKGTANMVEIATKAGKKVIKAG